MASNFGLVISGIPGLPTNFTLDISKTNFDLNVFGIVRVQINPGGVAVLVKADGTIVTANINVDPLWVDKEATNVDPNTGKTFSNTLKATQVLNPNERLISQNGNYIAVFQTDGNFCVYPIKQIGVPAACTFQSTPRPGAAVLRMQKDQNLVIYDAASKPLWHTVTNLPTLSDAHKLVLQNNGRLVITNGTTTAFYVPGGLKL